MTMLAATTWHKGKHAVVWGRDGGGMCRESRESGVKGASRQIRLQQLSS
jgi:hypothetical protein